MLFPIQQRRKETDVPSLEAILFRSIFLLRQIFAVLTTTNFILKQIKAGIKKVYYNLIFFNERVGRTFQ